jgi:CHAT domain-containing protein
MKFRTQIFRFVTICIFYYVTVDNTILSGNNPVIISHLVNPENMFPGASSTQKTSDEIAGINKDLLNLLTIDDLANSKLVAIKLIQKLANGNFEEKILSDSYYYLGIYYLKTKNIDESLRYLFICKSIKEKNKEVDIRYSKILYNIGVAYSTKGDLNKFSQYAENSLAVGKVIYDKMDTNLLAMYLSLVTAYINQKEYEKVISNSNFAISIANNNINSAPSIVASLYCDLGVCYNRLADFSKAKIYFDKTESIFRNSGLPQNDFYLSLMNSMAINFDALGMTEESGNYYKKAAKVAVLMNSPDAYNLINSYSNFLALNGKVDEGEKLHRNLLERSKVSYKYIPDIYYEVLLNYANYLREFKPDINKSITCYEECINYLSKNDQNAFLKYRVYTGYSTALGIKGEFGKALDVIQSLLLPGKITEYYVNPSADNLKPDVTYLRILKIKYDLLSHSYKKTPDQKTLEAAANTSQLIILMLDKVRINISEEESRLILGDRYRDAYLNAIHDFNLLYSKTSDSKYLEKAFEYSERSKVAGLLTSTRELKASQFHIPVEIGNFERDLQREIGIINARISEESYNTKPDSALIAQWKETLLSSTRKRDSLVLVFEKEYPDYYAIKYNTRILGLKDIPSIIGRDGNYINYVVSGNTLYTFIVNNEHQKLLATPIDSSFFNDVKAFRRLLSMPSSGDESLNYKEFQSTGFRLYKMLIEPAKPYLISDHVIVSPDSYLSYLPLETIPVSTLAEGDFKYKDIHYLMEDLDISYTYSATFMAESEMKESGSKNNLIAFAPDYPEPIDIQSALMSRQAGVGKLNDLPFARQEAAYVTGITGGKLYENSAAKESVFKAESGKYDIIHLAMHTLLNDRDPMRSTLIFSHVNDSVDDGYLKTYEIYGIPLNAKMVVLSSCNTGTGQLNSGEGILSLARGFIYSGSQSVVMSMWEIEDRSGTDIVKMFYDNLKKGYSKSVSLKKARISFLKKADNLRSHPYFWSSLVVYGNNTPLYRNNIVRIPVIIVFFGVVVLSALYLRKRKYS